MLSVMLFLLKFLCSSARLKIGDTEKFDYGCRFYHAIISFSMFNVFGFVSSRDNLCKNCKRPGHYARECPNVAICHNCGLPG